jgi:hypothetical protein
VISNSQDQKPAVQKPLPDLSDTSDVVIGCAVAAKLCARKDGKFGRTTTTEIFKFVTLLRKQIATRRMEAGKPVIIDLSTSWNKQIEIRLSPKSVAAVDHFAKQSVGPLTEVAFKCIAFVEQRSLRENPCISTRQRQG